MKPFLALSLLSSVIAVNAFAGASEAVRTKIGLLSGQFALAQKTHYTGELAVRSRNSSIRAAMEGFVYLPGGDYVITPETTQAEIALRTVGEVGENGPRGYDFSFLRLSSGQAFHVNPSAQRASVNEVPDSVVNILASKLSGVNGTVAGLPNNADLKMAIDFPFTPVDWMPYDHGSLLVRRAESLSSAELANLVNANPASGLKNLLELMNCGSVDILPNSSSIVVHLKDVAYAPGADLNLPPNKHAYAIPFTADVTLAADGSLVSIERLNAGTPFASGGYAVDCHRL